LEHPLKEKVMKIQQERKRKKPADKHGKTSGEGLQNPALYGSGRILNTTFVLNG